MTETVPTDERRARVGRLLQFLHELIRLKSNVVRDVDDHDATLWIGDEMGIPLRAKAAAGAIVLELRSDGPASDEFAILAGMLDDLGERPESLELVLASGLLVVVDGDDRDTEPVVREHLLTQAVVAEHDHTAGIITVRLAHDSAPQLHDSVLLAGLDGFDVTKSVHVTDELSAAGSVVAKSIPEVLDDWRASVVSSDAQVKLTLSPALVLRQRGSAALLRFYEVMMATVNDPDSTVPVGLAQLVTAIETDERIAALAKVGAMSADELVEDALYPLPSNVEQRAILAQLGSDSGVVVEGPPGTGKTHTIANLMSALLAKGQRVLVVSEKAQALRVLRDKLPPELRELAVSMADAAVDGSASLAHSVSAIASRKANFSEPVATSEIKNLRSKRDQARARREQILREIWQLRESETEEHEWVAPGYSGTAAQIVRQCQARGDQFDWLPGPLDAVLPPLDSDEMARLVTLLRARDVSWAQRLGHALPDLATLLPDGVELDTLCARVRDQPVEEMTGSGSLLAVVADLDGDRLATIQTLCDQLGVAVSEVRSLDSSIVGMTEKLLSGESAYLWNRVTQVSSVIDEAVTDDEAIGTHDVAVVNPQAATASVFDDAATYIRDGGQWRGKFRKSSQQRAVEEAHAGATVNGQSPTDAESLGLVARHLRVLNAVHRASEILADVDITVETTGSRSAQLSALVALDESLGWVSELLTGRDALIKALESISPGGPRPKSIAEVADVAAQTRQLAATHAGQHARRTLQSYAHALSNDVDNGPSVEGEALVAALTSADAQRIRDARREYTLARSQREQQGALDLLELRLKKGAPNFAQKLVETVDDPAWDARLHDLDDAWAWRRAYSWVAQRSEPDRESQLANELDAVDVDIAHFTAGVAAACAWRECLEHMSVAQVQALQSYRDHMTNVGRGSGKHAQRFRRAARSAMVQAQSAVPAWIMPIADVLTSIEPQQNSFDVVIVDEASQADITSLFLLWLAPRVIVVGDDRQCAPGGFTGAGLDDVFTRLDNYLPDVPQFMRDSLTPRSSLFTMLRTRFGHVVALREHFRSMPEIIEFSSRQFYPDSPLVPVRQFGADRLSPLRSVLVPDAIAVGDGASLTNAIEAQALVDAVVACCSDKRYDEMTFGIVVLQGQRQVDMISQRLRSAISGAEWHRRELRVGTPPDFQGDERHVIFLSMVVSVDRQPVSLVRNESQRRFNVAASRAMNQLWLFHSVASADLRSNDLRYSLATYMERTRTGVIEPVLPGITSTERSEPFDSLFEQKIFNELVARGFHVNPKVSVNNRVIDLVVTGDSGRLAVECDGDEFTTTPEQSRADMERERELRRCGWRFWRIRESEYLFDTERALAGLWAELDARGVTPMNLDVEIMDGSDSASVWSPIDLVGAD